jgi:membrane protease subunit (stomatin/prohibitin family)
LPSAIKNHNINILEIDENLDMLSEIIRHSIVPGFEEYGLTIPQFYISNLVLPENDPNFRRLRELHTISFQTRMIQAEALVKTAHAEAAASVTAAQRQVELEKQTTETEIARRSAERDIIRAQAEAQAAKMAGMAEAEVMAAKGYTQRDVLSAEVQKAYAEGIGNMTISGNGGGVAGDMIGLGVGMAAAGAVAPQLGEMFKGFSVPQAAPAEKAPEAKCAKCGAVLPQNAKFCLECGEKVAPAVPADMIVCPGCGSTVAKGKFCPECGHKFITSCPKCGKDVPAGAKFCLECGEKL